MTNDLTNNHTLNVHLYRFDDEFQCWELLAGFRLHRDAEVAALALSAASENNPTYAVTDDRFQPRLSFFYSAGADLGLVNPTDVGLSL